MKSLRIAQAALVAGTTIALAFGTATASSADGSGARHGSDHRDGTAVTAPASARTAARVSASRPVDITSISGSKVMTYKSKSVNVRYRAVKTSGVSSFYVLSGGVYRGSKWVGSAGSYPLFSGGSGAPAFRNSWGRGLFTLKNLKLRVYMKDGSTREYTDNAGGGFRVRSGIDGKLRYGNVVQINRHGSARSVKVGLKRFTANGWRSYKTKVRFQYSKGGHWKTRKTIRLNGKGVGHYKFHSNRRHKYRVVVKRTGTTAGGKTRGITV